MAVGAARDLARVHGVYTFHTRDSLCNHDAFMTGLMGKPRRPNKISYGVDVRHASLTPFIHGDVAPICLHTGFFQTNVFNVPGNANSGNHFFSFESFSFSTDVDGRCDA